MRPNLQLPERFELETGEKLVLVTRQHWYVFRNPFLVAFFLPFLALAAVFFIDFSGWPDWFKNPVNQGLLFLAGGLAGLGFLMFIWRLFLWTRTLYILTNRRLILVLQRGLFSREDRECSLSMIQDVRTVVDGIQPTIYGFGDIVVQVSSQDARLVLEKVGKPHLTQHAIMKEAHLG